MEKILGFLFLFPALISLSQVAKFPVISLPVERKGIQLANPWTGGMNAPQFSPIDLNSDGINDLFVFDRGGDRVLTYINDDSNSDTAFHYAPGYEKFFPAMSGWAVIRDYNKDNMPDIFTYQTGEIDPHGQQVPTGIKVYKGSRVGGNLHFDVLHYCLYYNVFPSVANLWVNGLGIPGIADVNRDGDLDVLTLNVFGTAVDYYENLAVELGRPADSLLFNKESACWGNFYHGSGSNNQVLLGVSCKSKGEIIQPAAGARHGGGAFSIIDNGNDHDIDLLFSGPNTDYMAMLNNSGDSSYARIGWVDTLFPSCNTSVRFPYFPNAYEIDGDNDGLNDLLLAPNFSTSALDIRNVKFYHNTTGDTCAYKYTGSDSFLVHTHLDFGTDSKGVFFDYNGDGLMDIVNGNYHVYNPVVQGFSKLALYENTGTDTAPRFREVTIDYSALSAFNLLAINPAFGDLDDDGKKDMLIGDKDGHIHFFKNAGGAVASFPSMTAPVYGNIDVGNFAAPFIYDINSDSLSDLLIGKFDGSLSYYWNFGTTGNPQFHSDSVNATFGNADVSPGSFTDGNSQPYIMTDSSGNMILYVGSGRGMVYEYLINPSNLRTGSFILLDSNFLRYDAGMNVTMQVHDLNSDGKPEFLVGNALGGLQLFSESIWDSGVLAINQIAPQNFFSVFPNPAADYFTCSFQNEELKNVSVAVFSILSEKLNVSYSVAGNRVIFSSSGLDNGIYIACISSGDKFYARKILIQR